MKKNMGSTDRLLRIVVVIALALLIYFEVVQGALAYVLMAVMGIFVLTSVVSFCPLYTIFGLNTCNVKQNK